VHHRFFFFTFFAAASIKYKVSNLTGSGQIDPHDRKIMAAQERPQKHISKRDASSLSREKRKTQLVTDSVAKRRPWRSQVLPGAQRP
jgi:hypothetical protein